MHISEGALSSPSGMAVLGAGVLFTAAGTAWALRRLDYERVPRVALLSAAFFVASFIRVPIGPSYAHLVLNGLMGLILGWAVFPALLVALLLQALLFQFGGLTTLGINTLVMAVPAVICHYLFRRVVRTGGDYMVVAAGVGAGAIGVVLAALLQAGVLLIAQSEFKVLGGLIATVNLALAVVEGFVTGSTVLFLRKVAPDLLEAPLLEERPLEASHA